MTRDEILNMPPTWALDILIAEKVMGLPEISLEDAPCPYCRDEMRYCGVRSWCSTCHEWRYSPYKDYCTDIAAAWEVVEKMEQESVYSMFVSINLRGGMWYVNFGQDPLFQTECFAETAPLAICRAALLAVVID